MTTNNDKNITIDNDPRSLGTREEEVEYSITRARVRILEKTPIQGNFDFDHLARIHARIFEGLYDFAGKQRVMDIYKQAVSPEGHREVGHFLPCQDIHFALVDFADDIKTNNYLRDLNSEQFIDKFTVLYARINEIHPFEEGNGRATKAMMLQLAKQAGYDVQYGNIPVQEWNYACKRALTDQQQFLGNDLITQTRDLSFLKAVMQKIITDDLSNSLSYPVEEKNIVVYVGQQANLFVTDNSSIDQKKKIDTFEPMLLKAAVEADQPVHLSLKSIQQSHVEQLIQYQLQGYAVSVIDLSTPEELRPSNHLLRMASMYSQENQNLQKLKNMANHTHKLTAPKQYSQYQGILFSVENGLALQKTNDGEYICHDANKIGISTDDLHQNISIQYQQSTEHAEIQLLSGVSRKKGLDQVDHPDSKPSNTDTDLKL